MRRCCPIRSDAGAQISDGLNPIVINIDIEVHTVFADVTADGDILAGVELFGLFEYFFHPFIGCNHMMKSGCSES